MNVLKFKINETYFDRFKEICQAKDSTVKNMLYITLTESDHEDFITNVFPEDFNENLRHLTLKVNNDLYKGVAKKCTRMDVSVRDYMQYLIFKCLKNNNKL